MTFRTTLAGDFSGTAFASDAPRLISAANRGAAIGDFLFGGSEALSIVNHAKLRASATVHGTPIYHPGYAELGIGGWYDLGVSDVPSITIIAVVQYLTAYSGWLCTQYGQGTPFTDLNVAGDASAYSANADGSEFTFSADILAKNGPNTWQILAMRVASGADYAVTLDGFTGGTRNPNGRTVASTGQSRAIGVGTFAAGSAHGSNDQGSTIGIGGIGILNVALSDAALLAEVQAITAIYAGLGITI